MTREHLYRRARAAFGTDHQIAKAREEAAELVLAICHRDRDGDDALGFAEILDSRHPRNDSGYADAGYDALLLEAGQASDPAERRAKLEAAERKMLDDAPILPIYFYASKHLVKPRVDGWQDNILDWHYSKDLRLRER